MQEQKFEELEDRASFAEKADELKQLEARTRVHKEIELMKAEGKALELSREEEQMLHSFRRFKSRMRKNGEVFKWQSCKPEGMQICDAGIIFKIVRAEETGVIVYPHEVT